MRADKLTKSRRLINEYYWIFRFGISLYLEPKDEAKSFYSPNDKRTYALVGFTTDGQSEMLDPVTPNLALQEFYDSTLAGLEKKIKQGVKKEEDVFSIIKTIQGKSLNDLKTY